MSHREIPVLTDTDKLVPGERAFPLWRLLAVVGLAGVILSLLYCILFTANGGTRFAFAYLIGFAFALAITLGNLFFVVITTLFKGGWHTAFRRVPETMAANMTTLAVLFIPIVIFVLIGGNKGLYPWADSAIHSPEALDHAMAEPTAQPFLPENKTFYTAAEADTEPADADHHGKDPHPEKHDADDMGHAPDYHAGEGGSMATSGKWTHTGDTWHGHDHGVPYYVQVRGLWYTKPFFILRWVIYFSIWILIARFYYRLSLKQDETADVTLTNRREWWAPLSTIAFAATVTLAANDLLVSLDPAWYSTMFGVYYFAGAFTLGICSIILTLMIGQRFGLFPVVNVEHYHDLGKLLFAFVFFWGYVTFSQYMLIWYASFPETAYWFEIRGFTSVEDAATFAGPWTLMGWLILFGHFVFPFAALLSKHVKRNRTALFIIACWMVFICYVDIFWIAMPALTSPDFPIPVPELLAAVGLVCLMLAGAVRLAARHPLTAYNDPRMHESLGLETAAWAPIHH